jgi:uncharacterized membrane protein
MVLFHDGISEFAKRLLFIVFAVSCIVSHYATTYIFFFVLLLTWIGMQIIHRILHASQSAALGIPRTPLKRGVTITIVALFFAMLFFWYSQVTVASFSSGVDFIQQTFANLNQWFLIESKGGVIAAATGKSALPTIPQKINFIFSWLTVAFVAIGVLSTVARYKRTVAIPDPEHIKPNFLYSKFEMEYFMLSLVCSAILVISVVLPHISTGYSMSRIYFQVMVVVAPFFVIGGIMVARWLRARPHWIILVVLIPFFMCTTGTMYQIFDVPASIALNSAGNEYNHLYVHDQESYGAKWLKKYGESKTKIYTDARQKYLVGQGKFSKNLLQYYPFPEHKMVSGYFFLRYYNVVNGKLAGAGGQPCNMTEYSDIFGDMDKNYANGGSEVWKN